MGRKKEGKKERENVEERKELQDSSHRFISKFVVNLALGKTTDPSYGSVSLLEIVKTLVTNLVV